MSARFGPNARRLVKYGPYVVAAAKVAREPAERAARDALDRRKARRDSLAHADAVVDGTVLRMSWQGSRVWVVWSGDSPIAAYPETAGSPPRPVPLDEVVRHADLRKRLAPDQVRQQSALRRARRATVDPVARRVSGSARPPGPRALP